LDGLIEYVKDYACNDIEMTRDDDEEDDVSDMSDIE
jgi:hypothetical protein